MSCDEIFEAAIHSLCEEATNEAIQEIAEDAQLRRSHRILRYISVRNVAHSPCKPRYEGWTPYFRPRPVPVASAQMLTKTCSAVDSGRDVSLTHSWVNCPPDEENDELRRTNADRVALWRTAYFTSPANHIRMREYETDPSIHAYMKYRYRGSLVDFACPTKKTRDTQAFGDFEVISMSDVHLALIDTPEMTEVIKVMEVSDVTEVGAVKQTDEGMEKIRKRRFLECCGH